jgi:hypothetical protein
MNAYATSLSHPGHVVTARRTVSIASGSIGNIASAATSTTRKCGICGPRPGRRDQDRGRSPHPLHKGR